MFGRISNAGIAIGVVVIVVGAILAWAWLGDSGMGDSPVDEEAGAEQQVEQQ